ncbi:MAG TPA: hypothetical protein VL547_09705 [Dinghuibacter sp.]|uniref:McrC family protein n=1 Tax=Dinghuibacter sp. TaxID=2024697 RepID=UPI002B70FFA5|nr:hypothetical protein [Dinghuibacter sp.]HTJ12290.1 hypothetical protein [Dinghuibacter sp.]
MATLTVYEHRSYRVGDLCGDVILSDAHLNRLQESYERNRQFYTLIHRGVRFCEYVGALAIGGLTIEVLPKIDGVPGNEAMWQHLLTTMLRTSGIADIRYSGFAPLSIHRHSILDLYVDMFLHEAQSLLHDGLVKKYSEKEGNQPALKGRLSFCKNIQHNLIHAERFYVRYGVLDRDNVFNGLLRQTLQVITRIGGVVGAGAAKALLLDFPDCRTVPVKHSTFDRLRYDRKTERYRQAMKIARMLLLNYHPDIRRGNDNVLALMFNMNRLWERYVFTGLRKILSPRYLVTEQVRRDFWKPEGQYMRIIRPDIVIHQAGRPVMVLDTKWKVMKDNRPDDDDLKQMLVYNIYNDTQTSALVYPSVGVQKGVTGVYQRGNYECSLLFLPLLKNLEIDWGVLIQFIESKATASNSPYTPS